MKQKKNCHAKTDTMRKAAAPHSPAEIPTPLRRRANAVRRAYWTLSFSLVLAFLLAVPAFAADSDPLAVINNLSAFIFSLIRAVGMILLGWGIVQVGLSFQSHDPSQRSQGFLTLAGGLVVTFAKEILELITGTAV